MAAPAPWDSASADQQLFVLVTGANSGIGLGIAQRLIDEFLDQRPTSHHLVLVTTTRSAAKSAATTASLRRHLIWHSDHNTTVQHRIHLASVQLDLCNLHSVYAAAAQLVGGTVAVSTGEEESTVAVRLPRLDAVVCNAGIGGWTGLSWGALLGDMLTAGLLKATTYPSCKRATAGLRVDPLTGRAVAVTTPDTDTGADNTLGQVFCANVFGHYVLAHELRTLLRRTQAQAQAGLPPARLVWESSVEAVCWRFLALDDLQGVRTAAAYESSKRLTDVLALTSSLPGTRPFVEAFWGEEADKKEADDKGESEGDRPPTSLLTHPGVVCSTLFPLPWLLFYLYNFAMYLARWVGSPWHPVSAYKGACAATWAVLQPPAVLAARTGSRSTARPDHVKWGASASWLGAVRVKKTEVEGWGWTGDFAADRDLDALEPAEAAETAPRQLQRRVGRRGGSTAATAEQRQEFEALGRACWQEMERLRVLWDGRVRAASKS